MNSSVPMRQSTNIKFNYAGGVQGSTYTQPYHSTTYAVNQQNVPHQSYSFNNTYHAQGENGVNFKTNAPVLQQKKPNDFPEAQEEEFTPGCCGKGSDGVVYESHEKNQAFC